MMFGSKNTSNLRRKYFLLLRISKVLPTGAFKWIDPKILDSNNYSSNSLIGCVLKVDLKYHKEIHELHNDYPLAPEKT